jgi:segregation and condensation protein A
MSTETAPDAPLATVDPAAAPVYSPQAATPNQAPQQQEMRLAIVLGQPVLQIPQDLYIPPDALEVILEAFEGPLDLLLYLIRRQNLDILDIPVASITKQYVEYIGVMREMRFELAAEYLVMAAILAEIKSRMLLPRPPSDEGLEHDPRADLVRRLQDYERFKQAAEDLDTLPRMDRDTSPVAAFVPDRASVKQPPPVQLKEMLLALHDVLKRAELFTGHAIKRDALSVRQRMTDVLDKLSDGSFHRFESLFEAREGKLGVVVTFLSILELAKERLLDIVQEAPLAPIYLKSLAAREGDNDTGMIDLRSEFDDDIVEAAPNDISADVVANQSNINPAPVVEDEAQIATGSTGTDAP